MLHWSCKRGEKSHLLHWNSFEGHFTQHNGRAKANNYYNFVHNYVVVQVVGISNAGEQ